jgi:hypothetical protein
MKEQLKGSLDFVKQGGDMKVRVAFQAFLSDFDILWNTKDRMASWDELF